MMDELKEDWNKFHSDEHHDPCSIPNVIRVIKSRVMRWAVYVARMGGRNIYTHTIFIKPQRKRIFTRSRRGWEENIKINLQ